MDNLQELANNKVKVRVYFTSGKSKWGWVHLYNGSYFLTRGNRVGFSLNNAVRIEVIK